MMTMNCRPRPSAVDGAVEALLGWLETPLSEVMIRDPVTADASERVRTVRARMSYSGAGHLPVVYNGRPIGLVTTRDLARSLPIPLSVIRREEMERLLSLPITEVMSAPAITLPASATLEDAVQRMVRCQVGSIMVVNPATGKLVGLITRSTITRAVATLGGKYA